MAWIFGILFLFNEILLPTKVMPSVLYFHFGWFQLLKWCQILVSKKISGSSFMYIQINYDIFFVPNAAKFNSTPTSLDT